MPYQPDEEAELLAIYEDARNKRRGEPQLLAVIARELIRIRAVLESQSNQHYEWPNG